MGHKEEQERDEREVVARVRGFINQRELNCYFGFSCDDVNRLDTVFSKLTQNNETTFPDFYGTDACVELFNISSSFSDEYKGSEQMRQDGELRAKIARDDKTSAISNDFTARTYARVHPDHSYDALTRNMHEQVRKHVKSKRAFDKRFDTSVFVMNLDEYDLSCAFRPHGLVGVDGLRIGDLAPVYANGKPYGLYRLSRDRENLEWLARFAGDVDYIVFCNPETIEAINVHHVQEIVAYLPWDMVAAANHSVTIASSIPLEDERPVSLYEQN